MVLVKDNFIKFFFLNLMQSARVVVTRKNLSNREHFVWYGCRFKDMPLLNLISISVAMPAYRYARRTRSVSIAYYAHLAAFRVRFYMEPEPSDSGSVTSAAASNRGGVGAM